MPPVTETKGWSMTIGSASPLRLQTICTPDQMLSPRALAGRGCREASHAPGIPIPAGRSRQGG
jgi:hypothetical protein